jgi:isopropylmalate/homocitrate/citramalate synthase
MTLKIDAGPAGESSANVLTGAFQTGFDQPIELYDNTLRDGEQAPGIAFSADEKLAIARALSDLGVHWANVGFPAVSAEELAAVQRITRAGLRMKTAALSRMTTGDIDITVESGVDLISLFLAGSDVHLLHKLQLTEAQAIASIEKHVAYAKTSGRAISVAIEDGSRTPMPRLVRMFQAAEAAGADYLVLADTVGVLTPSATSAVFRTLNAVLGKPVGVHFHDDLGLALANTLAALEAGTQLVHVTMTGVGERSGNTCLEELAVVLAVKYGRDLGLRLDRLYEVAELVHRSIGSRPPEHKAITGKWAFTHESGIHVAGILANADTYQPFPPALIGRQHEIVFGKHSGARSITYLAERHGVTLGDAGVRTVLEQVKQRGQQKGGSPVSETDVLAWIHAAAR